MSKDTRAGVPMTANDQERTYRISRMRREGKTTTIKTGLTLAEAQAHCKRDDARGPDWFDRYTDA